MSLGRSDPGECIVCGAVHCACTDDSGPILIAQTPAFDAAHRAAEPPPSEPFTTGTYRRLIKKPSLPIGTEAPTATRPGATHGAHDPGAAPHSGHGRPPSGSPVVPSPSRGTDDS